MTTDEDEISSDSTPTFTRRQWVHPLDRYLEVCAEPDIQGFILLRSTKTDDERCFFLSTHVTKLEELPSKLLEAFACIRHSLDGQLLPYVRSHSVTENGRNKIVEGANSSASIHVMELWFTTEIKSAWEKYGKARALSRAFQCALEFLRRTEKDPVQQRELLVYYVNQVVPIRDQELDRYWTFLAKCQDYLAGSAVLKPNERQFGHITDWIPNSKLPKFDKEPRQFDTPSQDDEPVMGLLPPAKSPATPPPPRPDTDDQMSLNVQAMQEPAPPPLRTIHRGRPVSLPPRKK